MNIPLRRCLATSGAPPCVCPEARLTTHPRYPSTVTREWQVLSHMQRIRSHSQA